MVCCSSSEPNDAQNRPARAFLRPLHLASTLGASNLARGTELKTLLTRFPSWCPSKPTAQRPSQLRAVLGIPICHNSNAQHLVIDEAQSLHIHAGFGPMEGGIVYNVEL